MLNLIYRSSTIKDIIKLKLDLHLFLSSQTILCIFNKIILKYFRPLVDHFMYIVWKLYISSPTQPREKSCSKNQVRKLTR